MNKHLTALNRGPALSFCEVLAKRETDPTERALLALTAAYHSIATDPTLTAEKRRAMIEEDAADFVDHCNKRLGSVPASFAKRAEDLTDAALAKAAASDQPVEDKTADDRKERERRAASARVNLKHPYDPPPKNGDDPKMETKQDAYDAMESIAKKERKPGETVQQAYARCLKNRDPAGVEMRKLYDVAKTLPHAEPAPEISKREEPDDAGYRAIVAKAVEIRKENPRLTEEQAFAKAWKANPALREAHRSAA